MTMMFTDSELADELAFLTVFDVLYKAERVTKAGLNLQDLAEVAVDSLAVNFSSDLKLPHGPITVATACATVWLARAVVAVHKDNRDIHHVSDDPNLALARTIARLTRSAFDLVAGIPNSDTNPPRYTFESISRATQIGIALRNCGDDLVAEFRKDVLFSSYSGMQEQDYAAVELIASYLEGGRNTPISYALFGSANHAVLGIDLARPITIVRAARRTMPAIHDCTTTKSNITNIDSEVVCYHTKMLLERFHVNDTIGVLLEGDFSLADVIISEFKFKRIRTVGPETAACLNQAKAYCEVHNIPFRIEDIGRALMEYQKSWTEMPDSSLLLQVFPFEVVKIFMRETYNIILPATLL